MTGWIKREGPSARQAGPDSSCDASRDASVEDDNGKIASRQPAASVTAPIGEGGVPGPPSSANYAEDGEDLQVPSSVRRQDCSSQANSIAVSPGGFI